MKKNQVLCQALNHDGIPMVADVLDIDDRSFRLFVCSVLMNSGALKAGDAPGEDIALHLMPGFTGIMPASEFEKMVKAQAEAEAAKKAAEEAAAPTPPPPGVSGAKPPALPTPPGMPGVSG